MWLENDRYENDAPIPAELDDYAGPYGVPVVRVFASGKTDPGWGMSPSRTGNFIEKYRKGEFERTPVLMGQVAGRWDFAFVMRGLALVCIDIDGKNGGLANLGKLGYLPETLTETSKSGNGYHLFYSTTEDQWETDRGFDLYKDRIGLYPGIDIRAVGCVYHYPAQRWNDRKIAPLPRHLHDKWTEPQQISGYTPQQIQMLFDDADSDTLLMIHSNLERDLAAPIQVGKRNITLFAIGSKMMLAQVEDWDEMVFKRALAAGLDREEAHKIVDNINKYGTVAP